VSAVMPAAGAVAALLALRMMVAQDEERVSVALTFPRTASADQAVAAVRSLAGLLPPWWRRWFGTPAVTLEIHASAEGIKHVLTMPQSRSEYVTAALRAAIPGLRITEADETDARFDLARELRPAGSGRLRVDEPEATNTAILASLAPLAEGERVAFQYVITPTAPLLPLGTWPTLFGQPTADAQPEQSEPELAAAIRIGVSAATDTRRGQIMARLLGSLHGLNGGARLARRLIPSAITAAAMQRAARPGTASVLTADELAAGLGLPLGGPELPGLTFAASRELAASSQIARRGLVLGDSTVAGDERPLALAFSEARRSIHCCAPTGAGKSTLITNLATQLMEAKDRPSLIVVDSKGDEISDLADRIPPERQEDVVIFDPADRERPVGFNLLGGSGETDLVVDHVVSELRARYGAAGLGPRSEDILRAALTTLTSGPEECSLCEVEPLLAGNSAFRQRLVGRLDNPVLQSFWAWFSALSDAARAEAIAPLSNKVRTFTLRPRVRAVIGQTGGLDLADALNSGKIVLISLAKGLIGADAAALIGAAMTSRLWAAIQARAAVPQSDRRPAMVICDEFQDFAAISPVFSEALVASRGYGVGWACVHQHLGQLDADTRNAVLANCRTRLVMQTTATDAAAFAREFRPYLDAADLQGLGAFEGYAAISTGAAVAPPASIRTRPAPKPLGSAERVRAASRERYGTPPADVDAAIRDRIGRAPAAPVGETRRGS
jgi:hypothetical protein